jgi:hypothetical protein
MAVFLSPAPIAWARERHVNMLAVKTMIPLCANIMDKDLHIENTPEQSFLAVIGAIIDVRVQGLSPRGVEASGWILNRCGVSVKTC